MAGSFAETTRLKLRRLLGTSLVSDVDEGFQRLAEDLDTKVVGYTEGTLAERPAAGVNNRLYRVTSGTGIGLYHDSGSAWFAIPELSSAGAYSGPAARTSGTEYEENANRPVFVTLTAYSTVAVATNSGFTSAVVRVGGSELMSAIVPVTNGLRSPQIPFSFLVPPGKKWSCTIVLEGGGLGTPLIQANILTI